MQIERDPSQQYEIESTQDEEGHHGNIQVPLPTGRESQATDTFRKVPIIDVAPAEKPTELAEQFEAAYREFEAMPMGPLPDHLPPDFQRYFTAIIHGERPEAISAEQIERISEQYLPEDPLIPIKDERRELLQKDVANYLTRMQDYDIWRTLGDSRTGLIPNMNLISPVPIEVYFGSSPPVSFKKLNDTDRRRLLTNPDLYLTTPVQINNMSGIGAALWGTRPISEYNKARGVQEVIEVTQAQDSDEKRILDIGGSIGLAAYNIETNNKNIAVTNLTTTPEPGVYPLRGGHRLGLGEQLPIEDFEKYGGIISNYAFPYMRYPHISLCNSLLAVKPGGIVALDYSEGSFARSRDEHLQHARESAEVFRKLDELSQKGAITYLPKHKNERIQAAGIPMNYASVAIKKNTSIDPEDLSQYDGFEF